jgi:hypothetical protein
MVSFAAMPAFLTVQPPVRKGFLWKNQQTHPLQGKRKRRLDSPTIRKRAIQNLYTIHTMFALSPLSANPFWTIADYLGHMRFISLASSPVNHHDK